ncbi:Hypothetical predicted protein [Mytilus galloprovincialis]|uniref:Integrase catalytic domain-containing protein n=1 Tax=Mytilus galloprovincialis TaxID=29158 RepID=A0A8B6E2U2_MYTGA|nr:Hypothetical predicted protein [Mytilus galloprovincialis]
MQLSVLNKLCCDIILGQDFMKRHDSIKISFGGSRPAVEINDSNTVCGLADPSVYPPALFANLTSECRPNATKSRKYSEVDRELIEKETTRLLTEGIIEPSISPWRAQVLVTSNERHKKRLIIDYSQTINRFTELDAYPFSNINQMVSDIAKYKKAVDELKSDLENASIRAIVEAIPSVVETDASDSAVAGSLNQGGRPVAFFSRTLNDHELEHSPVEKEACAIIDAVCKWRHLLSGKHFTLFTDQEAVSYMFDSMKHGPLPSVSTKKYILTVVDEYSTFPFAFPCSVMTSATVIQCLRQLFALFDMPGYIHSDRGQSFMSAELKTFLQSHGVATSRTTPYNPQSNGQCERYNEWLANPGPILMKKHVRATKYNPLVEEVDLLEANPTYAHVRLPDGRETTVSVPHLAPRGLQ